MLRLLLCCLTLALVLVVPALAQPAPRAPVVVLPLDLTTGLLVVRNLTVNGQRGDFIVDTGCEYALVLEQTAFAGQLSPATSGLSTTGLVKQYQLPITSFQFGTARYAGFTAMATSLAAVRPLVGPRLLGLIGYGILRHYEVVVDYARRQLTCYPLGQA